MAFSHSWSAASDASVLEAKMRKYDPVLTLQIRHLGVKTLHLLSLHLDPETHYNNWTTLGEKLQFNNLEILKLGEERDRTAAIIRAYGTTCATLEYLIRIIHDDMRRHDVFTDENVLQSILNDDERRRRRSTGSTPLLNIPRAENRSRSFDTSSFGSFNSDATLTPFEPGFRERLPAQPESAMQDPGISSTVPNSTQYPLLISDFNDRDIVIDKILPKVEVEWEIRLCLPDRELYMDMVRSENFRQFAKRCRKVIIVLSDELFQGSNGEWLANFILDESYNANSRVFLVKYKPYFAEDIFNYIPCCEFCETIPENTSWQKLREYLI